MGRSRAQQAPELRSFPVGDLIFCEPLPDGIQVFRVLIRMKAAGSLRNRSKLHVSSGSAALDAIRQGIPFLRWRKGEAVANRRLPMRKTQEILRLHFAACLRPLRGYRSPSARFLG